MLHPMSQTLRRGLIIGLIVIVVITLGTQLRASLGIELDVESVRAFAVGLGPMGPLLFIGVVALRGLLALPSQVVLIAAGLCFGTLIGTLVGATGLMLSGLGIFMGVRYAGRKELLARAGKKFGRILDASGDRRGAIALALGSGYPISPLSAIHAAAGLTPMSALSFILAAFTGGLIRASIFSYFGNAITDSDKSAYLYSAIGLLALIAIPLCFEASRNWLAALFRIGNRKESPATDPE